jgi:type II secretion system protein N
MYLVSGVAWFLLVFMVTWWMTFPSDAFLGRAQWAVNEASGGTVALKASSISPWWTGVKANDVKVFSVDMSGDGAATQMVSADAVRLRVGLFGLMRDDIGFSGKVDLGDGRINYAGRVSGVFANEVKLGDLDVDLDAFPVRQLFGLMGASAGDMVDGSGEIDASLNLDMTDGPGEADGKLTLKGDGLSLMLKVPDPLAGGDEVFDFGPIQISDLDIKLDIDEGVIEVDKGRLVSDQISVEMGGDMKLEDEWGRSRMRFKFTLSDLGDQIEPFSSFMNRAKWADDKYHYSANCRMSRVSTRCFRPERQRKSRASSSSASENPPEFGMPGDDDQLEQDRERRRKERAERRKSRAKRPGADDEGEDDRDEEDDREDDTDRGEDDSDERLEDDEGPLGNRDELPALEPLQQPLEEQPQQGGEDLDFE